MDWGWNADRNGDGVVEWYEAEADGLDLSWIEGLLVAGATVGLIAIVVAALIAADVLAHRLLVKGYNPWVQHAAMFGVILLGVFIVLSLVLPVTI